MGLLNTLYKIIELDTSKYAFNYAIATSATSASQKEFAIQADNFDLPKVNSVFWNYGDPYDKVTNEVFKYDLSPGSHTYKVNGIYDVNCIINADSYVVHLTTKANILVDQNSMNTNVVSGENNSNISIQCYDPQARIVYSILTSAGETDWINYTGNFVLPSGSPYYLYKGLLSDGTSTQIYLNVLGDLTINYLEVYDPVYDSENNLTAYTTAGYTNNTAITATTISANTYAVSASRAVKVQFLFGDVDISNSSIFRVLYYKDSLQGNKDNIFSTDPEAQNITRTYYNEPLIIKSNDVLYWQLRTIGDIIITGNDIYTSDIKITRGIGHDNISLNTWIGNTPTP